eukprot:RCo020160
MPALWVRVLRLLMEETELPIDRSIRHWRLFSLQVSSATIQCADHFSNSSGGRLTTPHILYLCVCRLEDLPQVASQFALKYIIPSHFCDVHLSVFLFVSSVVFLHDRSLHGCVVAVS